MAAEVLETPAEDRGCWWADGMDLEAGRTVTSTLFRLLESGEAMRAAEVLEVDELVCCAEAVAAMCASSSCSCWSALTNAAFKRFVCSAFNAFLTLVVTQFSHITFTSLPETVIKWHYLYADTTIYKYKFS